MCCFSRLLSCYIILFSLFHIPIYPANSAAGTVAGALKPYMLPDDHPIKAKLDKLFSSQRATLNLKTLAKAGFSAPAPRKFTHLVVAWHPEFEGYIFKLYLDAQRYYKDVPEWKYWLARIKGAELIRREVAKNNWQAFFKVPKKWIYQLPDSPAPPKEYLRKDFILVEEDMDIYEREINNELWKSSAITPQLLTRYFTILETLGLSDCAKPDNSPFSKDGRIAFVDTQTFHSWPVSYRKMKPFLSTQMLDYWISLTAKARKN